MWSKSFPSSVACFGPGPAAPIVDDQTVLIEICSIFLIGADFAGSRRFVNRLSVTEHQLSLAVAKLQLSASFLGASGHVSTGMRGDLGSH